MPNEVKLLPCPFCGGEAKLFQSQQTGLWFITCNDCDASTGAQFINDTDEHIRAVTAAWNTRPTIVTDEVVERVKRVERQVASCSDSYEAPSGKIMMRVWITDLAAVVKLARAAMPAIVGGEGWQPIESARKQYRDGEPPILTWGPQHGYGLTYGPCKDGTYGPQILWQPLPAQPESTP